MAATGGECDSDRRKPIRITTICQRTQVGRSDVSRRAAGPGTDHDGDWHCRPRWNSRCYDNCAMAATNRCITECATNSPLSPVLSNSVRHACCQGSSSSPGGAVVNSQGASPWDGRSVGFSFLAPEGRQTDAPPGLKDLAVFTTRGLRRWLLTAAPPGLKRKTTLSTSVPNTIAVLRGEGSGVRG